MYCRLFLVFFLLFCSNVIHGQNNNWNCSESEENGWSCGDKADSENPDVKLQNSELEPIEADNVIPADQQNNETPPEVSQQDSGWNCYANDVEGTWNCSLSGNDPQGKEKSIRDGRSSFSLFDDAFNFDQEQNFALLRSQLSYDPWQNCQGRSASQFRGLPDKDLRETAPMDVKADYSEVFDKEITSFFGNVVISRADQKIQADRASYDTFSETMDAQGKVVYTENELSLMSDTAQLNLGNDEARLRNAIFMYPSGPIRGSSDVVYRDNKVLSRYSNAAITSCRPGNQDWVLHADRLKINKQSGKGAAKHAWMEFKSIPLMYLPYISFPIDDRRTSGILVPSFGSTDENGFDLTVPYYWNIAPNYDLTLRPRLMTRRGGMLGAEFRYLTEMSQGQVGVEYLPFDAVRQEQRYAGTFKNFTQFTKNIFSYVDLNYVSDDAYFDELNNALSLSNNRFLQSQANLAYRRKGVSFVSRFESYQTLDKDVLDSNEPYQKLPQVTLNLRHAFEDWPVEVAMQNEYVNFYRSGRVSGHRLNLKPSITFPFQTLGAYIKPKFSLQHTEYFLSDQDPSKESNIQRILPIASVDSGLVYERAYEFSKGSFVHTIEPRLFYLYIPYEDQDDIPVFDSTFYDFNFSSMFRENRFSGSDRIQDANQITMAITSRIIDQQTGKEAIKLNLGQIYYFQDRRVSLTGRSETNSFSNLVAELSFRLSKNWSFNSGIHWNPDDNDIDRGTVRLSYRDLTDGKIFNASYRYRRDTRTINPILGAPIIQTDASFRWPIYDNWYGVGRWQYSLLHNSTTESFLGLEKESCCWRFRLIWRRFANTLLDPQDDEMDEGIFVQFEFKGLSSFGDKVDEFLERSLSGYRRTR